MLSRPRALGDVDAGSRFLFRLPGRIEREDRPGAAPIAAARRDGDVALPPIASTRD
jgi:hypothetical protein